MNASKTKLHELVDSMTDEQAERALEVLRDIDPPPGVLSTGDPDYAAELQRRWDDMESGKDPGVPAEKVFRELRTRLRRRRA